MEIQQCFLKTTCVWFASIAMLDSMFTYTGHSPLTSRFGSDFRLGQVAWPLNSLKAPPDGHCEVARFVELGVDVDHGFRMFGVCVPNGFNILFERSVQIVELGGGFKYVLFSPLPAEMIQFDEHIFQMGWFNHQLVKHFVLGVSWRCHSHHISHW